MTRDETHPATSRVDDLVERVDDMDGARVVGDMDVHPDGESWLVTMRVEIAPDVGELLGED